MRIQSSYLPSFAKLFGRSLLQEFIGNDVPREFHDLLKFSNALKDHENGRITYRDLFNKVYTILSKRYRCEYIFKNTLLRNELLRSRHQRNVSFLNELAVGSSQADIVAVNGTTTVYEIKTGLDTLSRLTEQLSNYIRAFDIVNILTEESKLHEIERFLKDHCRYESSVGVLLLQAGQLETVREAKSNFHELDLSIMFSILRQKQVKDHFGTKKLQEAKALFCALDKLEAQDIFKKLLREKSVDFKHISALPISLKMAGYALRNLTKKEKQNWLEKLEKPVCI